MVLLIVVGGFVGYVAFTGKKLDASSLECIDLAVPAIVVYWTENELTARAAPRLIQESTPVQLTKILTRLRNLDPCASLLRVHRASICIFYATARESRFSILRYARKVQERRSNDQRRLDAKQNSGLGNFGLPSKFTF